MTRRKIILDCDPGVDDALAILLALASPDEIEVLGLTTVAGNVTLPQTTRNALRVLALAGRPDIPVFAGCGRSIMDAARQEEAIHGTDGLGDTGLPDAPFAAAAGHAVDFIIGTVTRAPAEVTLCLIGPMTNLAVALVKAPEIAGCIAHVAFMGGAAFCPGNVTPAAEFNVWFDPHAAQIVLASGIPLTMFGLDVTRQVRPGAAWREALAACDGGPARAAAAMLGRYGGGDHPLHDPCVLAWLIDPSLFDGVEAIVSVDCAASLSLGRIDVAISDRHRSGRPANCRVITQADADGVMALLGERLRRL